MLRVCWSLSGAELTTFPLAKMPDVRTLKRALHECHGAPPRFQQAIFHNGRSLTDETKLEVEEVELLLVAFVQTSGQQAFELAHAAACGDVVGVESLLQRPQDPDHVCYHGLCEFGEFTALCRAAAHGQLECLDLLLEAGADINSNVRLCKTPLSLAANAGHLHVVRRLLAGGADVHARKETVYLPGMTIRGTALCGACLRGREEIARSLLEAGAASDLVEIRRAMWCCRYGRLPKTSTVVRLLQQKRRQRFGPFARRTNLACRRR
ncbi:ANKRD17 [Symbiodinium natans]|uniref:ANKRD17 protein n=1 Tax=Symbiodinium natans TaxID=878477 RepID=A0A812Q1S8_9DINO|nr:ANKRD17 [Symbiodinium natans]